MKQLIILFIVFIFVGTASAGTAYYNTTNIMGDVCPEIVGGTNVVTLHPHYIDNWFSVYNDGSVSYMIYAYDYIGLHDPPYVASFIGTIEPNQMGVLNSNASYYIYASYSDLDALSTKTIEKRINQYWFITILIVILIILGLKLYKVIKK